MDKKSKKNKDIAQEQPAETKNKEEKNKKTNDSLLLEEQMSRRQSEPRQTPFSTLAALSRRQGGFTGQQQNIIPKIGREQVNSATQTLQKYKQGKANLENRITDNEQWYKLRHWESMRKSNEGKNKAEQIEPASGWLFNAIANKHADAMDNFPSPNILPREEGDKGEAEMLTSILPVILDQNDFEDTYSKVWNYKLKSGTGVYGIFWDKSKLNGLGDISIKKIDILNLFWEPGITDIQKSQNLFCVELVDNDLLISKYPQLQGKLGTSTINVSEYLYDDTVDTSNKSVVVDWYYKKTGKDGKTILHLCTYVDDYVLFATENEINPTINTETGEIVALPMSETGLYDHGRYPFEFDPLFETEGTPTGFGYIDIGKNAQEFIDRGNQAILQNTLSNARPRYFIRDDGGVNEEEYADMTKDFVHVNGSITDDHVMPINGKPLSNIYVSVISNKIDELKEVTGNRDVSTGGTTSGVTAASAIAAMQEAGSKLSRDNIKASYRVFRRICLVCIELIRQFYDLPRCFRIIGQNGTMNFIQYSNQGIRPQSQGGIEFNVDMGNRVPYFDVEITAQKQSPYSKMAQNEMALEFFNVGMFNPQISDQALACLDMMDFDRKDFVMQRIAQNGTMYQTIIALQQQMLSLGAMVDNARGGDEVVSSLAQQFGMQAQGFAPAAKTSKNALGDSKESETTNKARRRVAESTSPT